MQIRIALPTYGQIAAELDRSSPGLQTRHKLANYLLQNELEAHSACLSVTILNNAMLINCNGADPEKMRSFASDSIKQIYSEVFETDLTAFLANNYLDE